MIPMMIMGTDEIGSKPRAVFLGNMRSFYQYFDSVFSGSVWLFLLFFSGSLPSIGSGYDYAELMYLPGGFFVGCLSKAASFSRSSRGLSKMATVPSLHGCFSEYSRSPGDVPPP